VLASTGKPEQAATPGGARFGEPTCQPFLEFSQAAAAHGA